ncbi:MAG: histidine kinase [Bacteroidota bacterium]
MKHKKLHILFVLMMVWSFSYGQKHTNYTIKDGLPSNHVYKLTQDKEGFIWVITDKGIVKFDGHKFKTFRTKDGLPSNDIWDIRVGPDNKIWYFAKSAKLGYIEDDKVHLFSVCDSTQVMYPATTFMLDTTVVLGSNIAFTLQDTCWKAIDRDHPHRDTTALEHRYINIVKILREKRKDEPFVSAVVRGKDSIMGLLNKSNYGVLNTNTGKLVHGELEEGFAEPSTFTRFHFLNDQIQVSGRSGVALLNSEYGVDSIVHVSKDLKPHFSMIDASGNVWTATFTNGLYKLPQRKRSSTYLMPNYKVRKMVFWKDQLVVSIQDKGFYIYNKQRKSLMPLLETERFIFSSTYIDSLDSYYFINDDRITRNRGSGFERLKRIERPADVATKLSYYNGYLYGITNIGLNKLDPKTLAVLDHISLVGIRDMLVFQGNLVLATSNGLRLLKDDRIENVAAPIKEFQNPILSLENVDDDHLIVATDGFGAFRSNLSTAHILPESEFSSVEDIYTEGNGLWLASEMGVLRYDRSKGTYQFVEIIDEEKGLPSEKTNSVIALGDQVLIGTDNGLAVIPKDLKTQPQLLNIYFESATFNDQIITAQDHSFKYMERSTFACSVGVVDFSEKRRSFVYQYKLLPDQEEWTTTNSSTLNFTDLKPNNYELIIRSGGFSKSKKFTVVPLWWQTQWFITVAILAGLLVFGLTLYFILKSFQKKYTKKLVQEKELAQIQLKALRSQMNPHFVFNSLAAIQYYINSNDFDASEIYLVKFSKLIRRFFELSKENEITIAEELELLKNYLEVEKLRFRDQFEYEINVDPALNGQQRKIPAMLLQPIVENAINHGIFNKLEKGCVTINFKHLGRDQLSVEIIDDGVGFVNTKKVGSKKIKSSNVLRDRLYFLNQSSIWDIEYSTKEAFPDRADKGNSSLFTIKKKS